MFDGNVRHGRRVVEAASDVRAWPGHPQRGGNRRPGNPQSWLVAARCVNWSLK